MKEGQRFAPFGRSSKLPSSQDQYTQREVEDAVHFRQWEFRVGSCVVYTTQAVEKETGQLLDSYRRVETAGAERKSVLMQKWYKLMGGIAHAAVALGIAQGELVNDDLTRKVIYTLGNGSELVGYAHPYPLWKSKKI